MSGLWHDLRFGARSLLRQKGFTLAASAALALGIGGTALMFGVIKAVLLSPPPFPAAHRLVFLFAGQKQMGIEKAGASAPDYTDWKRLAHSFSEMGAGNATSVNLTGDGDPERLAASRVSASFLRALGVKPLLGRLFTDEEEAPGRDQVLILSYGLWKRRFGGVSGVIGKQAMLNGKPYSIVGVMPPGMEFPEGRQAWFPSRMTSQDDELRGRRGIAVVARLRDGVTIGQAQQEMDIIAKALASQFPRTNTGWDVVLSSVPEEFVHEIRPLLYALFGAVGFVLLIACANVANLLLARFSWRRRETAIRAALGANRWRLTRQLMIESVLLALTGGALGLIPALWGADLFRAYAIQEQFHSPDWIRIDAGVLLFAFAVSLFTGILFGAIPAFVSSHSDLQHSLKSGERGSTSSHGWTRNALVVAEVALAVMLLTGAGLMMESFARIRSVDPGFRAERVMTMSLSLPAAKYEADAVRANFATDLVSSLERIPGVRSAAVSSVLPLSGEDNGRGVFVSGRPAPAPGEIPIGYYRAVTPSYLKTMSIPLLRGRFITDSDTEKTMQVVVMNQRMAATLFGSEDPLGKVVRFGRDEKTNPAVRVVGVVGDVRHLGLTQPPKAEIYLPYRQAPSRELVLVIKTAGNPEAVTGASREALRRLDPNLPLFNVRTMEQVVAASTSDQKLTALVFAVFGLAALLLAAVGIYSVMAYLVAQRTAEIGIRMAIGASRRDVLSMVMRQGLPLAGAGILIGIAGSLALTRVLSGILYGVSPTDPLVFLKVVACLLAAAALASLIPAWRAARLEPLNALRHE